jgi:hypothetical protein
LGRLFARRWKIDQHEMILVVQIIFATLINDRHKIVLASWWKSSDCRGGSWTSIGIAFAATLRLRFRDAFRTTHAAYRARFSTKG